MFLNRAGIQAENIKNIELPGADRKNLEIRLINGKTIQLDIRVSAKV